MPSGPVGVPNGGRKNDENPPKVSSSAGRQAEEVLVFGEFSLLPAEGRLLKGAEPVALAPKPFETLVYLVGRAGHVVTKQELLDAIWPGTFVTDDVLVQAVVDLRRALGDSAREPRFVQTIAKRGYLFVAGVTVETPGAAPPAPPLIRAARGPVQEPARVMPFPRAVTDAKPEPVSPPRRRAWILVLGALATLAVVGIWWVALGRLSRGLPGAAGYRPEPGSVAVMPIQTLESDADAAWLRLGLSEIIGSEVAHRPGLKVVPRQLTDSALRALGAGESATVGAELALRAARSLGAERLVTGSYQRVDDRFVLRAQVFDVASGRVERDLSTRGTRAELLASVSDLCRRLASGFPGVVGDGSASTAPSPSPPPPATSVEAYRAYMEALEAESAGGRDALQRAAAKLDEAIRLDPEFARAHLRKALVAEAQLRWGYSQNDPRLAVRRAQALESRLPERERLLIDGLGALMDGDSGRAVDRWTTLLKIYPGFAQDVGAPALIADTLRTEGRWDDLILATERYADAPAVPERERALMSALLASAFRRKGELGPAVTYVRRAIDLWPAQEGPAVLRLETQLGRFLVDSGQHDEALQLFLKVAASPQADVVNLTDAAWGCYMVGDREKAARLVERALALDPDYGNAYHLRGWLRLTAGDAAPAAVDLRAAFGKTPVGFGSPDQGMIAGDLAALYYAGVADERAGNPAAARGAWRQVIARAREALEPGGTTRNNPVVTWQAEHLIAIASARLGIRAEDPAPLEQDDALSVLQSARLHAVRRELERAIDDLRRAISLGAGDLRHMRDDPNFEPLAGRPEFEQLFAGLPQG